MSGSSREAMLSRIRGAVGARPRDPERLARVEGRLAAAPLGVIPARGRLAPGDRVTLFAAMVEAASATLSRVARYEDVPAAVAQWLRAANQPATLRIGGDPRLARADFGATTLDVGHGPSEGDDLNGLSHAEGGIAETGTLVLLSGADNPTSLNFLPENHIVVIAAKDVLGDMEAFWPRLRERYGKGRMPRSVNFVTGPSRSADIEQTLLLGAHGPRVLHVVIVEEA